MGVRRKPTGVPGRSWAVSKQRKSRGCKKSLLRQTLGALGFFLGKLTSYILEPCWVYPFSKGPCLGTQLPNSVKVTVFYFKKY